MWEVQWSKVADRQWLNSYASAGSSAIDLELDVIHERFPSPQHFLDDRLDFRRRAANSDGLIGEGRENDDLRCYISDLNMRYLFSRFPDRQLIIVDDFFDPQSKNR